jgi:hypothetical protein
MSTIRSVTLATTPESPCPCGCSPCTETGCKLECGARPRFFCGQLLTDQDLESLVGWTRDRLALSRFRHGWGVACGLEVRRDPDPRQPARVLVSPGYAVSCCGDDVVVCAEAGLDLRDACRDDKDPCADLRRSLSSEADPPPERAVDLYLRYREEPAEPQTALCRSACQPVSTCEPSRVRESFELVWRPVVSGSDPRDSEARRWEEEYKRCEEVSVAFFNEFGDLDTRDPDQIRRWLLRWIDVHPLRQLGFVRDRVSTLSDDDVVRDDQLGAILYWLIQDCRNAFLHCGCHACAADTGVPLARVCLRSGPQGDCRIVAIDPYPPYRRPLGPECWPAPPGKVNLGRFLWQREEEVRAALADLGVRVTRSLSFTPPAVLRARYQRLAGPIFASGDEPVCLQVFVPPAETCLAPAGRVVGFSCIVEDDEGVINSEAPAPPPVAARPAPARKAGKGKA